MFSEERNFELIELLLNLNELFSVPYHQASVTGLEKIPDRQVLFIGNHNGAMLSIDSFIFLSKLYQKNGRKGFPFSLVNERFTQIPLIKEIFHLFGGRAAGKKMSQEIIDRGHNLLIYPGGDIEAMRPFRDRNKIVFSGRKGYIRLAIEKNIPIVPVVAEGAHSVYFIIDDLKSLAKLVNARELLRCHVWPLTLSIPFGLTLGPPIYFPLPVKIQIEVLEPIIFGKTGKEMAANEEYVTECAIRVENVMQYTLTKMANKY